MEINSPEDFREQPVIDIEVRYVGGDGDVFTINDEPNNQPIVSDDCVTFTFLAAYVVIERRNAKMWSVRKRIDRIPIKKEGAPSTAPQQPEGGMAGN